MIEVNDEKDAELARAAAEIERIKAASNFDAYKMRAESEAMEMKMKGYTYQDEARRLVSTKTVDSMPLTGCFGSSSGVSGLAEEAVKVGIIKEMGKEITSNIIQTMK